MKDIKENSLLKLERFSSDEALRRRLHTGVKKFSRQGMVKTGEWGKFAGHIHYQQGDFKKLQT
jgi:hypothetical protein